MKWIVGIPAFLLAVVIAAGVFGPRFVDWNAYKPEIESRIASATGLQAEIDGNIGLALLPSPRVTAAAIRFESDDGADGSVRWLEARLRLSDLIKGEVRPVALTLVEPSVMLRSGIAGTALSTLLRDADIGLSEGAAPAATAIPGQRSALTVTFQDGTVTIEGEGPAWRIAGIDGSVATPAVGRRVTVDLSLPVDGRTLAVQGRFVPPRDGESGPVSAVLQTEDGSFRGRFGGNWGLKEGALVAEGEVSIQAENGRLLRLAGPVMGGLGDRMAVPFQVESTVSYDGARQRMMFSNLSLGSDPLSASGTAALDLGARPRVALQLGFSRLDADTLVRGGGVGPAAGPSDLAAGGEENPEADAAPRPALSAVGGLPFDLSLDLSALGTRFLGTLVQRLTLRASVEQGAVTVEELSARLPGSTDLSVAGFGDLSDPEGAIEGNASVRSDDLRRFLEWSGLTMPAVAPERLRSFSLVSGVSLRHDRVDIVDASVSLDDVHARAAAAVVLGSRVGVGLRLDIDQLNLDAFGLFVEGGAPAPAATGAPAGPAGGDADIAAAAPAEPFWGVFDASAEVRVGRFTAAGVPVTGLALRAGLAQGVLTLDEVSAEDAGGVRGKGEGRFTFQNGAPRGEFRFQGETEDFGRFVAVLDGPDWVAGTLRGIGDGSVLLTYEASQDGQAAALSAEGRNGGFAAALSPMDGVSWLSGTLVRDGRLSAPGWSLNGFSGAVLRRGETLALKGGKGRLNGGAFDLDAAMGPGADGLNQFSLRGAIRDLAITRAVGDLDGRLGIDGSVSLSGDFQATGSDWRALESTNSGTLQLSGNVRAQLGKPRTTIVNVKRVTDVRDALSRYFSRPGRVSGSLTVLNGALGTDGIVWSGAEGAEIGLSGRLDAKRGTLSGEAVLTAPHPAGGARLLVDGDASAPNLRLSGR